MLELKYFKELPCRSLNANTSYVQLSGADLYCDCDSNRYAFISVKNNYSKPFFSLYLFIKEYDSAGSFLRENKFSIPTIYGTSGIHVIQDPIQLDRACDGIEVFIYLAEYNGHNFYNDKYSRAGHEKTVFSAEHLNERVKTSHNTESLKLDVKKTTNEEIVEEEVEEEANNTETPVLTEKSSSVVTKGKTTPNFLPIIFGIIAAIIVFVGLFVIANYVNKLNQSSFDPGYNDDYYYAFKEAGRHIINLITSWKF